MNSTYELSMRRKFVLRSILVFYSLILTISWLGIAMMVGMSLEIGQNALAWAYTILGTGLFLIIVLILIVPCKEIWMWLEGIVVREQGISIEGEEIAWEEIGEVYTNPDDDFVTIFGVVPDETVARKYIRKWHFTEVAKLIEDLRDHGVNVIEESERKSVRFREKPDRT